MDQSNVVPLRPDIRDRLKALMDGDKRITQARIAKECGISATTVSQWIAGIYPGDNAAIEDKLDRWINQQRQQKATAAMLPAAPAYVPTPTAERVVGALHYAQVAGDMAVVYGGAGLGKTTGIRRYAETALNCWVATMTPARANVVTALKEIANAVGAPSTVGGADDLHRGIERKVAGAAGLIVIDEAQHLSVAALDQIRSIHDATGVGIALVGNEQVYARMTGGNRAAYLDRLLSRIGKRVRLPKTTHADVDALLKAWGIEDRECRGHLIEIAEKPGGLRSFTKVLRLAAMRSAVAERGLCCADVRAAAAELGGEA